MHQALCQRLAVGTAVGDAARALEVRNPVQQLGIGPLPSSASSAARSSPSSSRGDGLEGRLVDGERLDGAQAARLLDDEILPSSISTLPSRSSACWEPLVIRMLSGLTAMPWRLR